jgi:hypothetical protein
MARFALSSRAADGEGPPRRKEIHTKIASALHEARDYEQVCF